MAGEATMIATMLARNRIALAPAVARRSSAGTRRKVEADAEVSVSDSKDPTGTDWWDGRKRSQSPVHQPAGGSFQSPQDPGLRNPGEVLLCSHGHKRDHPFPSQC